MTCSYCRFSILKNSFRGPMCFKNKDINNVSNCKSYEPDFIHFDYEDIEKRVFAELVDKPPIPTLKRNGSLLIIGTPNGKEQCRQ